MNDGIGSGFLVLAGLVTIRLVPLPPPDHGAVDVKIADFIGRVDNDPKSLTNVPVRIVGFVADDAKHPGGFLLTRFWLTCCAADAFPVQLRVTGAAPPKQDT